MNIALVQQIAGCLQTVRLSQKSTNTNAESFTDFAIHEFYLSSSETHISHEY